MEMLTEAGDALVAFFPFSLLMSRVLQTKKRPLPKTLSEKKEKKAKKPKTNADGTIAKGYNTMEIIHACVD